MDELLSEEEDKKKNAKPKASKLEVLQRVRVVQDWILNDYSYSDIITSAETRFDVGKRQAERYYAAAYQGFKKDDEESLDHKKAYYLSKKKKLIRDMDPQYKKTPSGIRTINKVLDSMAQLEGIVIQKYELTGKDGGPIEMESTVFILPDNNRD